MSERFETLRTEDSGKRVVCEFDYDSLTVATRFDKSGIRYARLDPERLLASLLISVLSDLIQTK